MQTHEDGRLRVIKFGPLEGSFGNNAYIVADTATGDAIVVDMPAGSEPLIEAAKEYNVRSIVLTHTHPDHWGGYDAVKGAFNVPVACHPAETLMPHEKMDRPLSHGEEIPVGGVMVKALHTPGHTPGSTCFLAGRFLLSGDTLFPGGPGRTRTPEDLQQTIDSITSRLHILPEGTLVLPGHGDDTTIGESKREYTVFASREHPPDLCGDVLWESS